MVVFHEEIRPAEQEASETPILVSQNFFRHGDRYRYVDNQKLDKYVTDEFLVQTVYGCQIVVTNPTSSPQKLDRAAAGAGRCHTGLECQADA